MTGEGASAPSDARLLDVCDAGRAVSPGERGLMLLLVARPDLSREAARDLPVGARDAALTEHFIRRYGPRAEAVADCPRCVEKLELDAPLEEFVAQAPASPASQPAEFAVNGRIVAMRTPTAGDLAALGRLLSADEAAEAQSALLRRCLVSGGPLRGEEEAEAAEKLAEIVAERDPLANITLDLACPACGARWSAGFDIVEFLWRRLETSAAALMRDIHCIARAYGWNEGEILALPPARRRRYVEMIGS